MRTPQRIELRPGQCYAAMLDGRSEVRLLQGALETTPPPAWLADTVLAQPERWHEGEQRRLGRSGWWQWSARAASVLLVMEPEPRLSWRTWLRGALASGPIAHGRSGP